jgi:hypothetical protein
LVYGSAASSFSIVFSSIEFIWCTHFQDQKSSLIKVDHCVPSFKPAGHARPPAGPRRVCADRPFR